MRCRFRRDPRRRHVRPVHGSGGDVPGPDRPSGRSSTSRAATSGRWRCSPDGTRLFAVNTPDNRLAIYDVGVGSLTLQAEVPGRPRAGRGGGPLEHRGVGREPPLGQRQHRRRSIRRPRRCRACRGRSSPATSRATSSSPDRAATAPSSRPRGAARTVRSPPTSRTPGTARALVQVWDANGLGRGARRHADREHRCSSATRRAPWRGAPTARRACTPASSTPATGRRRSPRRS